MSIVRAASANRCRSVEAEDRLVVHIVANGANLDLKFKRKPAGFCERLKRLDDGPMDTDNHIQRLLKKLKKQNILVFDVVYVIWLFYKNNIKIIT